MAKRRKGAVNHAHDTRGKKKQEEPTGGLLVRRGAARGAYGLLITGDPNPNPNPNPNPDPDPHPHPNPNSDPDPDPEP